MIYVPIKKVDLPSQLKDVEILPEGEEALHQEPMMMFPSKPPIQAGTFDDSNMDNYVPIVAVG